MRRQSPNIQHTVQFADNHNYIYHCKFKNGIENPRELDGELLEIDGVIDTGLFIGMASKVIIGTSNGIKIIE